MQLELTTAEAGSLVRLLNIYAELESDRAINTNGTAVRQMRERRSSEAITLADKIRVTLLTEAGK